MKKVNDEYSRIWPNITENRDSPYGDALKDEPDKYDKYFKENIKE